MVKLVGNDTMEEINAYFDYENNFPQLLEDYITKSSEVHKILDKSSSKDKLKQIRNIRHQMKKLHENGDHEKPRMKVFKNWMSNYYEQKKMKYHKKDNDLEKDELIRNLKNELLKKDETIIQLENENKHYRKKIKKLRKQLNLDKPKPTPVEDNEPAPEPEPKPEPPPQPEPLPEPEPPQEPSPELLKMMDPDYDSDDDIVEKPPPPPRPKEEPKPSIISDNTDFMNAKEKEDYDEYEQNIKAECERKAREKEEHIEKKNKTLDILEKYYNQCDLEIDKMEKKFKKEVKKADRIKKSIKNDYCMFLEDILEELKEEYLENHDELDELSKEKKLQMIYKPIDIFESRLPSEMVQIEAMNK